MASEAAPQMTFTFTFIFHTGINSDVGPNSGSRALAEGLLQLDVMVISGAVLFAWASA